MNKRTRKPYLESPEAFQEFLITAQEPDAWNAISEVAGMAINSRHKKHKHQHANRLEVMFEIGTKTYFDRFNKEWTPF